MIFEILYVSPAYGYGAKLIVRNRNLVLLGGKRPEIILGVPTLNELGLDTPAKKLVEMLREIEESKSQALIARIVDRNASAKNGIVYVGETAFESLDGVDYVLQPNSTVSFITDNAETREMLNLTQVSERVKCMSKVQLRYNSKC